MSSDFSKSSPSLLFNAASMADLLGPRGGSREGGKRVAKGKVVGSKSSADMSKDLINSILKQETGDTSSRRVTPGKKKKAGSKKKNPSQQQTRSSSSSRGVSSGHSMSMSGPNASSMMGLGQQSNARSQMEVEQPASVGPLDMARMAHNANNNVHVFAQGMVASSEEKFDGSASDDVNYLERQYEKVQNILKANETKLVDGYEQLVGEAGGPNASSIRFNSEDAKLLLLFAGITELDEVACEDLCSRCEVVSEANNEDRFAQAAEEFVKREEGGGDSEAKGVATTTTTTDSWGNDTSLPEVDFHRWRIAVMAALRHRLMAGVLASRRGQLAPNFIEQAEVSANMVSILGPHPSTNRKKKAARQASAADVNHLGGPGASVDDLDSEGELGADSVTEVRDLAEDLFGDSVAETEHAGHGVARTHSADGGGVASRRRGSRSGVMPLDGGSFLNNSSFVSAQGSTTDGLPPLQMPHNKSQRALKNKRKLQKQAGFDDSFTRGTPRVLHEMSRTDPGKRKAGKGPSGGFGSSQSLVGGDSVATVGSSRSKGSKQLQAGASVEDILALKAELQNTQEGLLQLGSLVDSGIAWVHSNVDMKQIAAGGALSDRTKDRCRKLAVEKWFSAFGSAIENAMAWSFQRWALAIRYEKVSQVARVYSRAKSLETLMRNLNDALLRQYLKVWSPWRTMVAIKQRWEKEAAAAEVQRTMRGFLGKVRAKYRRANRAATIIQCLARRVRAKRRVATRRKYLTLHRAAKALQFYFKGLVLMRKAREECDRRRELKIARKLLREQKAYQDRIKREAEEKMKRESAARKKAANRSAASKIADRADKKAENKKSKGRAAPKSSPDKGGKGGKGSPKNMSPVGRPAPIDPSARSHSPYSPGGSSAASPGGMGASPGSPGGRASPYGAYGAAPARSPLAIGGSPGSPTAVTNTEEALRMKEEAERFLRENDPAYAELARAREEELERLRQRAAELEGSQRPSSRGAAEDHAAGAGNGSGDKSSRSPSPSGEKKGWFGSSSSSPSPTDDGKEKRGWFGVKKSPSGDSDAGAQPASRVNSIDSEVGQDKDSGSEGKKGLFGGMFGSSARKSPSTTPPPESASDPGSLSPAGGADGQWGSQPVTRQPSIKEQDDHDQPYEEEEDEYLTPEQVAEQDRLRAIEEEKRILREKEEAYNESIRQKELELQAEAEEKGKAIMERDRIREEREAKERAIQEEEEARQKAIQDAIDEERRKQEEEEERLEAEEEERERREEELERLRQQVIAEERANMQAELDKIRKEAAAQAAQMEAEREELKQLKLDAIGNTRGRGGGGGSPTKQASNKVSQPSSPGRGIGGMFGGMFGGGSRPSSAAPAAGFTAGAAHDATGTKANETGAGDTKGADRPASAVASTPTKASDSSSDGAGRPKSASGLGGMFSSLKGAFSGSKAKLGGGGGGFGGLMGGPKRKFKPFDPDTYEFIEREEALRRIQCQIRIKLAKRRVQKKREKMTAEHKRLGELLLWAIVLIQRTARARQGRHRFRRFKLMKEEEHERLRHRSATKIASTVRGKLARNRVKLLWLKRGEQMKAAEWKDYQKKTDRKAKLKVLAAGTPRPDVDEDNDIVTWGVDPEQVDQLDQKIAKLEAIEKSIEAREKAMADAQRLSEERAKILEDQLIRLEQRQKAEEAERAMQAELMSNAMGSVPSTARSTARGPPPQHHPGAKRSARGSAPPSARGGPPTDRSTARSQGDHHHPPASARHSAPPTARSARDPDGIPKDAPRMTHEGVEWVQLWDPDEKATYWYCESTQAAQWETPGEPAYDYTHYDSGYDTDHTSGAMTDYSTDYASGAESEWSEWQNEGEWQEYWDESAQAKYWYNESTGEASWTPPEGYGGGGGGGGPAPVPASAREMPDEWVSYVDEATGQEYWYNSRTGETSWA